MDMKQHMIVSEMEKVKMIKEQQIKYRFLKIVLIKVLLENMNVVILNIRKMMNGKLDV